MPFTEIELRYIENSAGKMCKQRSPINLRDKLRIDYEVKGLDVVVYEERPYWDDQSEWTKWGLLSSNIAERMMSGSSIG